MLFKLIEFSVLSEVTNNDDIVLVVFNGLDLFFFSDELGLVRLDREGKSANFSCF